MSEVNYWAVIVLIFALWLILAWQCHDLGVQLNRIEHSIEVLADHNSTDS